ncbi:cytochrome P450 [Streptomyces sp. ITFR-21]|nr:cytochrome P450 [Streptomyces sp. ITFR-21]WNI19019.1 cytochrome P450 [Streptomyces sp. ITFR-21]
MGGVVPAPWGGRLVTSFDLCDRILRSRDWLEPDTQWRARQGEATRWSAVSSQEMGRTLAGLNPPDHTRVRRSVGNMFDRTALSALRTSITDITSGLVDRLTERLHDGEADFHDLVSEELPVLTIGRWLGLPPADYPYLRELTHEQVFAQELLPSASQLARSDAATRQLRDYFIALVRERRAAPGADPVSGWIRVWDTMESDREAADEAVYFLALFVLLAALETTSTLLSTMMWLLLKHPRQWDWLRAHPDHVPGAVEEVLRYDSPTHVISRVAKTDTAIADWPVGADEMVHLMVGAANHDPDKHLDAHLFDVRRKATHLSFSNGIHYCLGAPLARLEAQSLLHGLLNRLPYLSLARDPEWAPRVAFRRVMTLPVVVTPA